MDARLTAVGTTLNTMAIESSQMQSSVATVRADVAEIKLGLAKLNNVLSNLDEVKGDVKEIQDKRKTQTQNFWAFWTAIAVAVIGLVGVGILAGTQLVR